MLNRTSVWLMVSLVLGTLACGCEQNNVKTTSYRLTADDQLMNLNELAGSLGMKIRSAKRGVIRLYNSSNKVLLFPAAGGAYVNSKLVGSSNDIAVFDGHVYVTRRLAKAIRVALLPAAPIAPVVTHTTTPPPPKPIISRSLGTVLLDAGHGGDDPGAISRNRLFEKDVVLMVSLDLANRLRQRNVDVKLTRGTDTFVTLDGRAEQANSLRPDLFVSIHADASLKRNVSGATIYVPRREARTSGSYRAGQNIFNSLSAANVPMRGLRTHEKNLRVLESTHCPAVLVELGFLTNSYEEQQLSSPAYQQRLAEALCNAIVEYLQR